MSTDELRLRNLIKSHEQYIRANRHDAEGVKEHQEWIEECQDELDKLLEKQKAAA